MSQTREQFIDDLFQIKKKDNLFRNEEARTKIITGVSKVVETIKSSYGPHGSNAIIESDLYPFHKTTNDGKAIAESIILSDRIENIGANIVKETANKSDKESGDGRKTSMILLDAILSEGAKYKISSIELKKGLDELKDIVISNLDTQTVSINADEIHSIAAVASENEELGKLFQEIYKKIGKDGIIEIENSPLPETSYEITNGIKLLNCKWKYEYMVNDTKSKSVVMMNPQIVITRQKLTSMYDLDRVLQYVKSLGINELVLFYDEIEASIEQALAYLYHGVTPQGQPIEKFKVTAIKAPTLWKDWLFEDFAKITGATIIDSTQGITLKSFKKEYLGTCEKIIIGKEDTVILGPKNFKEHLTYLKKQTDDDSKIRVARLQTKTAILKLGANSDSELSYLRGKAVDARNSSYLALNHGVLTGGGVALANASIKMTNIDSIAAQILREALLAPYKILTENAGMTWEEKDMIEQKVYDSAVVVKNAFINALSVASIILTCKTAITK